MPVERSATEKSSSLVAAGEPESTVVAEASPASVFGVDAPTATLEHLVLMYLYSNQVRHQGDLARIVVETKVDLGEVERYLADVHAEMLPLLRDRVQAATPPAAGAAATVREAQALKASCELGSEVSSRNEHGSFAQNPSAAPAVNPCASAVTIGTSATGVGSTIVSRLKSAMSSTEPRTGKKSRIARLPNPLPTCPCVQCTIGPPTSSAAYAGTAVMASGQIG